MPTAKFTYDSPSGRPSPVVREEQIEYGFIGKLQNLKYEYRADIRDRASLERNFREKFEALNRVHLTDGEFARLLDEIVTPDVFTAARTLRNINAFTREDGTPLNYTLVNIKDWCKTRLKSSTSCASTPTTATIVPCVQVELKTLGINPRRAMEQIVGYKNDPGNGYTKTLLCFLQLFIVSNRTNTYYFAKPFINTWSAGSSPAALPAPVATTEGTTFWSPSSAKAVVSALSAKLSVYAVEFPIRFALNGTVLPKVTRHGAQGGGS